MDKKMTKKILYISAACFLLIGTKLSAMGGEGEFTKYVKGKKVDATKLKKNIIDKLKSAGMKKDTEYYKRIIDNLDNKRKEESFRKILNNATEKEIVDMVKYFNYKKDLSMFTLKNKDDHRKNKAEMRGQAIKFWHVLPDRLKNNSKVLNEFAIKEKEGFLTDVYNENYVKNNNKKKQREAFDFLKVVVSGVDMATYKKIAKSADKVFREIKAEKNNKEQQNQIKSLKNQIKRQKNQSIDKIQQMRNKSSKKEENLYMLEKKLEQQNLQNQNMLKKIEIERKRLERELDEKNKQINALTKENEELESYFVDEEVSTEADTDIDDDSSDYDSDDKEESGNDGGQTITSERGGRGRATRSPGRSNVSRAGRTRSQASNKERQSRSRRRMSSRSNTANNRSRGRQRSSSGSTRSSNRRR